MQGKINVPEFRSQPRWMITARSFFIDRGIPKVERILLPGGHYPGGVVEYGIQDSKKVVRSANLKPRKKLLIKLFGEKKPKSISENLILDFRSYHPGNWSHSVNSHLPLACFLREQLVLSKPSQKLDIVFDERVPDYIIDLFSYFGFSCLRYSGPVIGQIYDYNAEPFACINSLAYDWISEYVISSGKFDDLFVESDDLPKKVFISRKGARSLINEVEVDNYLSGLGYTKVYSEEMSIADQFRLLIHATDVVAVHGAALGPMLYRPRSKPSLNLVEIFTAGHISAHFRIMADKIGAKWVGVRGLIDPGMIKGAYRFDEQFVEYSLKPFRIDIESLKYALEGITDQDSFLTKS